MLGVRSIHAVRDELKRAVERYNERPARMPPRLSSRGGGGAAGRRGSGPPAGRRPAGARPSDADGGGGGGAGLSEAGLAAVLADLVGGKDEAAALRRVRALVALEADVEAKACELALCVGLPPDASLGQIAAKLRAEEARRAESTELVDAASARELLLKLRAHDGPSAIKALEAMELKAAEYRKILGRFQQQMTSFAAQAGGGALRDVVRRPAATAAAGPGSPRAAGTGSSAAALSGRAGASSSSSSSWQTAAGGTVQSQRAGAVGTGVVGRGRGTRYAPTSTSSGGAFR
jgi:hypothetical protein